MIGKRGPRGHLYKVEHPRMVQRALKPEVFSFLEELSMALLERPEADCLYDENPKTRMFGLRSRVLKRYDMTADKDLPFSVFFHVWPISAKYGGGVNVVHISLEFAEVLVERAGTVEELLMTVDLLGWDEAFKAIFDELWEEWQYAAIIEICNKAYQPEQFNQLSGIWTNGGTYTFQNTVMWSGSSSQAQTIAIPNITSGKPVIIRTNASSIKNIKIV